MTIIMRLQRVGEYDCLCSYELDQQGRMHHQVAGYHSQPMRRWQLSPGQQDNVMKLARDLVDCCHDVTAGPNESVPPFAWQVELFSTGSVDARAGYTALPPTPIQDQPLQALLTMFARA